MILKLIKIFSESSRDSEPFSFTIGVGKGRHQEGYKKDGEDTLYELPCTKAK